MLKNRTPGAKALISSDFYGTAEAVPFVSDLFASGEVLILV